LFYRDTTSTEADNNGTIIVDGNGVRWKRANVHEEYYASWFGVSTHLDDNSPLIQNALNVMPSGSILIFGPGIYKCKQTIKIPDLYGDQLKYITIQGSSKLPGDVFGYRTRLQYTGPNPSYLMPFIDFRGSTGNKTFLGAIRNIMFYGLGKDSNIVGLWFYKCAGSLFDSVFVQSFKHGIQIDYHYYYSKFNDVLCAYCDYGLKANGIGNGAVFNYCNFKTSNVGFGYNLNGGFCSGVQLNDCYFEGNKTAIKSHIRNSLHIHKCYFEGNTEYIIDVYNSNTNMSPLLVLKDSYMLIRPDDLVSNKAAIKQTLPSGGHMSYVINDNVITNEITVPDYFIYVAGGNITIKAENNMLTDPTNSFPICSKTPVETSYFNNDFS